MNWREDGAAYAVLPAIMVAAFAAIGGSNWIALTVAGLAMGAMLFLMAAGLTLIFWLMDVLNFAHGAFIPLGAFIAVSVLGRLSGLQGADSLALNLAALGIAVLAGAAATGVVGYAYERIIIRRVYGSHM